MSDAEATSEALCEGRFDPALRRSRERLWRTLCEAFFQRYIEPSDAVLDLGAGFCDFINNVQAGSRWAIDSGAHVRRHAAPGVHVHQGPATDLSWLPDGSMDVVFCSNVFEHFPSRSAVLDSLREVHRVLRPGGRLLVLQPNVRYAYREYWDFFDHNLAFSDRAMIEGLRVCGFGVLEARARFLPFTTTGRLPMWSWLVRLYLRLPLAHRLLGKQMFLVGERLEGRSAEAPAGRSAS